MVGFSNLLYISKFTPLLFCLLLLFLSFTPLFLDHSLSLSKLLAFFSLYLILSLPFVLLSTRSLCNNHDSNCSSCWLVAATASGDAGCSNWERTLHNYTSDQYLHSLLKVGESTHSILQLTKERGLMEYILVINRMKEMQHQIIWIWYHTKYNHK